MIDLANGICFVKIPKTAGTSVLMTFLGPHGLALEDGSAPPVINLNSVHPFRIADEFRVPGHTKRMNGWHVSARDMRRWLGSMWESFATVSVVRDPFDRAVSIYEWQRGKGRDTGTFDEFVARLADEPQSLNAQARLHAVPQHAWLTSEDGELLVESVLRFEELPRALDNFTTSHGLGRSPLAHRNASSRGALGDYFHSQTTTSTVVSLYEQDFEAFGYSTNPRDEAPSDQS